MCYRNVGHGEQKGKEEIVKIFSESYVPDKIHRAFQSPYPVTAKI